MSRQNEELSTLNFTRSDIFPDLLSLDGPLKIYRSKSSIDYRKMRLIVDTFESWDLRFKVWNFIKDHPLFINNLETLSIDEMRRISTVRMMELARQKFYTIDDAVERPELAWKFGTCCGTEDRALGKLGLSFNMFPITILALGSERNFDVVEENKRLENIGCFALTEFAHGSNTMGVQTTATYEPSTESFVLNSPEFEAGKTWVGNLGKTATHALVYAQLYTADGAWHGLNAFVVPIRDKKTMLAYPGVIVGDLGEKIGMNGLDNGFVIFNNYKIPKANLLSRFGDINDSGNFVSQIKDPKKRMAMLFLPLSGGRAGICEAAASYATSAITIAIRYSAARKQFGPEGSNEIPVLEYQAQQYRTIPHLAETYVMKFFSNWINLEYSKMSRRIMQGEIDENLLMEIHAISSAGKPACGWMTRDLIQNCREACGGHGYLKCAKIGDIRDTNDPNCTYEGENNVLIQQTSNYLLSLREKGWKSFEGASRIGTCGFLKDGEEILKRKWKGVEDALDVENLLHTFNFIVAFLVQKTFNRVKTLKSNSRFETRNNSQVFNAIPLSIAFAHRQMLAVSYAAVQRLEDSPEKKVLMKVLSLFGANLIVTKYLATLHEGGFQPKGEMLENGILELLNDLKDEAVTLVDAIAPPDWVLNSPLGMSDGNFYKHLENFLYQSPETFTRPKWWREILPKSKI